MTPEEAGIEAVRRWGKSARAWQRTGRVSPHERCVVRSGRYAYMGIGPDFEAAFADAEKRHKAALAEAQKEQK